MPRQVSPEKRKQRYEQVRVAIWCLTGSMPTRAMAGRWQANYLGVHHCEELREAVARMVWWLQEHCPEGEP